MKCRDVAERWGMTFRELLESIAAQGLNMKTASKITGIKTGTIHAYMRDKDFKVEFEQSPYKAGVAEREGVPFWEFVTALKEAGASRAEVAKRTGASYKGFLGVMQASPDKDPFPPSSVSIRYVREAGETIVSGARRMIASGMSMIAVSRALGYSETSSLRYALIARGITDVREFARNARMGI